MAKVEVSASILSADCARLGEEVKGLLAAGVDSIHFDVMDMHYVPNLTFGPVILKSLKPWVINAPIHVHLMVDKVLELLQPFAQAGADSLIFHFQSDVDPAECIAEIHKLGCKAGVAISPDQPVDLILPWIDKLDRVLLMTVHPGFAGQSFVADGLLRINQAAEILKNTEVVLEVDGGIKLTNCLSIAKAGAHSLVMGSGLFDCDNYEQQVRRVRQEMDL